MALFPFALKDLLVLLPYKQDSQTKNGSTANYELKGPSTTSLWILPKLIWPNFTCQGNIWFILEGSFLLFVIEDVLFDTLFCSHSAGWQGYMLGFMGDRLSQPEYVFVSVLFITIKCNTSMLRRSSIHIVHAPRHKKEWLALKDQLVLLPYKQDSQTRNGSTTNYELKGPSTTNLWILPKLIWPNFTYQRNIWFILEGSFLLFVIEDVLFDTLFCSHGAGWKGYMLGFMGDRLSQPEYVFVSVFFIIVKCNTSMLERSPIHIVYAPRHKKEWQQE